LVGYLPFLPFYPVSMSNETPEFSQGVNSTKQLHTLIPLEDFKAILGVDDRENALARYCLLTAAYAIEQYCKRRLLLKQHFERIGVYGDLLLPLGEYPVREVLGVWEYGEGLGVEGGEGIEIVEPEFYRVIPDCGDLEDVPHCLSVSPALRLIREMSGIRVHYWAGYACGEVPPDLGSACLELAAWNMARYRGRRIGMTGAIRGSGKDGEHLETSMPENVRGLLEPYRRKML
jgi:hypothetical protein